MSRIAFTGVEALAQSCDHPDKRSQPWTIAPYLMLGGFPRIERSDDAALFKSYDRALVGTVGLRHTSGLCGQGMHYEVSVLQEPLHVVSRRNLSGVAAGYCSETIYRRWRLYALGAVWQGNLTRSDAASVQDLLLAPERAYYAGALGGGQYRLVPHVYAFADFRVMLQITGVEAGRAHNHYAAGLMIDVRK